jgi:hypothetical protein
MRLLTLALASILFAQAPALRIVVLEGEDAVNIVQQKTAVRPLVEVRDRNNVPVAGATVTFTIGGGQPAAFAGGVQTLTVTTNAAGQAAASGFNVLGPGAIQVQVQAAYQGQLATAAISQTNFATAAAASQAGGSTGAASGGAAGGGGGGISGTTIGIIGGAVAGGAVAATQLTKSDEGSADVEGRGTSFSAPVTGQIVVSTTTGNTTCVSTRAINSTLKITLSQGNATGSADMTGTLNETSFTSSPNCSAFPGNSTSFHADVTGGPSNLTFLFTSTATGPTPTGGSVTATEKWEFKGSFSSGSITGTLSYAHQTRGSNPGGSNITGDGSTSFSLTLR